MTLMLEPPPSPLPMFRGRRRPFRWEQGWLSKAQSRSEPRFSGHREGSMRAGDRLPSPASNSSTRASCRSARRAATTQPAEPAPQTMKSNPSVRVRPRHDWFCATAWAWRMSSSFCSIGKTPRIETGRGGMGHAAQARLAPTLLQRSGGSCSPAEPSFRSCCSASWLSRCVADDRSGACRIGAAPSPRRRG